jgi:hypothetical protein
MASPRRVTWYSGLGDKPPKERVDFGPTKPYTGGCVAVPEYTMELIMQRVQTDCVVVIDTLDNLHGEL